LRNGFEDTCIATGSTRAKGEAAKRDVRVCEDCEDRAAMKPFEKGLLSVLSLNDIQEEDPFNEQAYWMYLDSYADLQQAANTPYVLIIEPGCKVSEDTDAGYAIELLEQNPEVFAVSGLERTGSSVGRQASFERVNDIVYLTPGDRCVFNTAVYRSSMLWELGIDGDYPHGERELLFWRANKPCLFTERFIFDRVESRPADPDYDELTRLKHGITIKQHEDTRPNLFLLWNGKAGGLLEPLEQWVELGWIRQMAPPGVFEERMDARIASQHAAMLPRPWVMDVGGRPNLNFLNAMDGRAMLVWLSSAGAVSQDSEVVQKMRAMRTQALYHEWRGLKMRV
jgi:hypothetical protein